MSPSSCADSDKAVVPRLRIAHLRSSTRLAAPVSRPWPSLVMFGVRAYVCRSLLLGRSVLHLVHRCRVGAKTSSTCMSCLETIVGFERGPSGRQGQTIPPNPAPLHLLPTITQDSRTVCPSTVPSFLLQRPLSSVSCQPNHGHLHLLCSPRQVTSTSLRTKHTSHHVFHPRYSRPLIPVFPPCQVDSRTKFLDNPSFCRAPNHPSHRTRLFHRRMVVPFPPGSYTVQGTLPSS